MTFLHAFSQFPPAGGNSLLFNTLLTHKPFIMYHPSVMGLSLYLKQMELGPMENFIYLIGDKNMSIVFNDNKYHQVSQIDLDTILSTFKFLK